MAIRPSAGSHRISHFMACSVDDSALTCRASYRG